MKFNEIYNQEDFLQFVSTFLPEDFAEEEEDIVIKKDRYKEITKAKILGFCESLDLHVLEMDHGRENDPRITIATDAFKILADHWIHRALVVFKSKNSDNYRLSFLKITLDSGDKNKVIKTYSSAKRHSFYLGPSAKVNTPTKYLIKNGRVVDFIDLESRFSLEVVNKEFYKQVSENFIKLVGGALGAGKKKQIQEALLKLPSISDKNQISLEFAVRLIGRIIFCWFLREKKSPTGVALMPKELLSLEAVAKHTDYYHQILESIFFEVLNKEAKSRGESYSSGSFSLIPYLNGGLFSPHEDDFYKRRNGEQSLYHNTLVIPDEWFVDFFKTLETYNFTIDENTSFDEELSVDPEMLGRIFENLLAEINPETGESARQSTGSFYTPRAIVDYMIDESLSLYLKNQTQIDSDKLKAAISYDLGDDATNPLNLNEKQKIVGALERVKILDPACGSGAFPIGALQKIVFILQQVDPDGQMWFTKQIQNTSPEIKRVIEREFAHKNFNYIRKLGIIRENIYGIDIQSIAIEISRLRCFLTLVVDERIQEDLVNRGIEPLPNLDFKFVVANTLFSLPGAESLSQSELFEDGAGIQELKGLRDLFFNASGVERDQLQLKFVQAQNRMFHRIISEGRKGLGQLTTQLSTWDPFSRNPSSWFDSEWMFGVKEGFDIVIANPPYVSTKGVEEDSKEQLENKYGFADDLYAHFYYRGLELCKRGGFLSYITSKTFWTIMTKKNLRELLLKNNIIDIYDTANPFESVLVDTCVVLAQKENRQENKINFLKADNDYSNPIRFEVDKSIYENAVNKVIFNPSPQNLAIYYKYNTTVSALMEKWWPLINTSKNITKYGKQLDEYRHSLKSGEVTLLGLMSDGGVGLQTGNNGKYVGILSPRKEAIKIKDERNKKLFGFITEKKIAEYGTSSVAIQESLNKLSEQEIRTLFDSLKNKYGQDIFGKGFLHRLVDPSEIKSVDKMSEEEKKNGISENGSFVPYDKGDKEGNRWYVRTPYYIDWSKENVNFLKKNTGKKGKNMPVFRNPQFYFKDGFSWNLINGTRTTNELKFTITEPAVNDMASNKLTSLMDNVSNKYIAAICNSRFINTYTENFINFTLNFPHNSTRQIPIIIPTKEQLANFEDLFDRAYAVKISQFDGKITNTIADQKLDEIQKELDNKVLKLYGLTPEEIGIIEAN